MKVIIEVTKTGLAKIKNLRISYKIIQEDLELRALLFSTTSVDELDDYEKEEIFDCAIRAMEYGEKFGILIETLSGRNMQDQRSYELESVKVVPASQADITVEQMKNV